MAAKKRGMSLEDKRAAILDIFHSSKEVYVLKVVRSSGACGSTELSACAGLAASVWLSLLMQDIEKIGAKRGVVQQSIKEVLQVGQSTERWKSKPERKRCSGRDEACMYGMHLTGEEGDNCIALLLLQGLVDDDLVHQEKIGVGNAMRKYSLAPSDAQLHVLSARPAVNPYLAAQLTRRPRHCVAGISNYFW